MIGRLAERPRVIEAKPRTERVTTTLFAVDIDPSPPPQFDTAPGSHLDLRVDLINRRAGFTGGVPSSLEDPAPGRWKVVVDASHVPGGSTTYQYLDVITNPRFGSLSTGDVPREHTLEEKWALTAHAWFAEAPEEDRVPTALILVTSGDIRQQVSQTQVKPDPHVEHVPLGWAAVLFDTNGLRVVTD